jgi:modification methylase
MFSFAGDTVLDPFAGTGATSVAAIAAGRNSISIDVEPSYLQLASENIRKAALNAGAIFQDYDIALRTAKAI